MTDDEWPFCLDCGQGAFFIKIPDGQPVDPATGWMGDPVLCPACVKDRIAAVESSLD